MIIVALAFVGFVWFEFIAFKHHKEDKAFRKALAAQTISKKDAREWLGKHFRRYPVTARLEFNQMIDALPESEGE